MENQAIQSAENARDMNTDIIIENFIGMFKSTKLEDAVTAACKETNESGRVYVLACSIHG
ncbi:hypothetical protein SAMN05216302_10524 [Nitrosomonas aestuarii]|uniref:Uncharacterized protein n=1 Tax=Nitrosomonas aestuarii TaxID=52441 RepID=A0A1I4GER2_9PROT|nr:hypothetical protein SAMN05216302_10524 [Nitrosomonas aestuarii]